VVLYKDTKFGGEIVHVKDNSEIVTALCIASLRR